MSSRRSFLAWCAGAAVAAGASADQDVEIWNTPEGGLQPKAAVDNRGVLHVVYLCGDPAAADVAYVRREPGQREFSAPVRVNSQPGSAIAVGTVRGAQIALGRGGRVHVAWNGSQKAEPKVAGKWNPVLYTRMRNDGRGFEPERNLAQASWGSDGATVAADPSGNVYVAWHAQPLPEGAAKGEDSRRVWMARSTDEGRTFARELAISPESIGVCACCGMTSRAGSSGLRILYRSARETVHRDMYVLHSTDGGRTFDARDLQAWEIGACPMSTEAITEAKGRVIAAWETDKQVYWQRIAPTGQAMPAPAPGQGPNRKHPSLATNTTGDVLLAWTEGTGWKKGGTLRWSVLAPDGRISANSGSTPKAIPAWSAPAAIVWDGRFVVLV